MPKFEYHRESAMPGKGPGVVCEGLNEACFHEMRAFVLNNWTDSDAYRLKEGVGPFLQGEDERSGWLFVEFWSTNQPNMNRYAEALHEIFKRHHVEVPATTRWTVEMFSDEALGKFMRGRILTLDEVRAWTKSGLAQKTEILPKGGGPGVCFYTTNHCYAYKVLPENFASCTTYSPRRIVPRPGFESGVLENAADELRFEQHCNPQLQFLQSVQELVDYLNQHYI